METLDEPDRLCRIGALENHSAGNRNRKRSRIDSPLPLCLRSAARAGGPARRRGAAAAGDRSVRSLLQRDPRPRSHRPERRHVPLIGVAHPLPFDPRLYHAPLGSYRDLPTEKKEPCVWPFERLNVDTLGRIRRLHGSPFVTGGSGPSGQTQFAPPRLALRRQAPPLLLASNEGSDTISVSSAS